MAISTATHIFTSYHSAYDQLICSCLLAMPVQLHSHRFDCFVLLEAIETHVVGLSHFGDSLPDLRCSTRAPGLGK